MNKPPMPFPPYLTTYDTRPVQVNGAVAQWGVAAEVAVEININQTPVAVMMATPDHVNDLAVGFALSEGVISGGATIDSVGVQTLPEGLIVDLRLATADVMTSRIRSRFLQGRSGCGLCGVETLADTIRAVHAVPAPVDVSDAAIKRAFAALPERQALNAQTRTVHAAAWCALDGDIQFVCEDVGRHNALDKLIGVRFRSVLDDGADAPGFVIMTSRCSFELVQKCAMVGIGLLATASAPTTLALDLARAAGVRVVCCAGDDIISFEEGAGDAG